MKFAEWNFFFSSQKDKNDADENEKIERDNENMYFFRVFREIAHKNVRNECFRWLNWKYSYFSLFIVRYRAIQHR